VIIIFHRGNYYGYNFLKIIKGKKVDCIDKNKSNKNIKKGSYKNQSTFINYYIL